MSEKDLHPYAKDRAQDMFLKAIEEHCPEVLQSLAADLLDRCRRLDLSDPRTFAKVDPRLLMAMFHEDAHPIFYYESRARFEKTAEESKAALESLKEWAANYGLKNFRWFLSRAGQTLQWWVHCEHSSDLDERGLVGKRWFFDSRYYKTEKLPPLGFNFRSFNPLTDSKKEYRAAARAQFKAELDRYLQDKPEYWQHGKREVNHFIWLARHLCRKDQISEIARSSKCEWKTVQDGIKTTADLLGIEISPGGQIDLKGIGEIG
jgi:hypothetical protein